MRVNHKCDSKVISDSKGKDLKFVPGRKYLSFYYKGGAEITNQQIQSYAKHQVTSKFNKYPIIVFWFGTCSFTEKVNGLFEIKDNLEKVVENTILAYKKTKQELKTLNPRAKVFFLECPFFSLSMFNEHKGKAFKTQNFITQ